VPQIVKALIQTLKTKRFDVLSNIDISKIIKEKTGENMDSYVILDVCNPKDAECALDAHKEVGLVLPWKITVYKNDDKVWVSLYKPTEALKVLGLSDLEPLAEEVEMELKEAINAIAANHGD